MISPGPAHTTCLDTIPFRLVYYVCLTWWKWHSWKWILGSSLLIWPGPVHYDGSVHYLPEDHPLQTCILCRSGEMAFMKVNIGFFSSDITKALFTSCPDTIPFRTCILCSYVLPGEMAFMKVNIGYFSSDMTMPCSLPVCTQSHSDLYIMLVCWNANLWEWILGSSLLIWPGPVHYDGSVLFLPGHNPLQTCVSCSILCGSGGIWCMA